MRIEDATGQETGSELVSADSKTGVVTARFFARDVPALGYKVYRLSAGPRPNGGQAAHWGPRQFFRLSLSRIGSCASPSTSRPAASPASSTSSNFESLASGACGNQLQFFKDTPKDYDAWNIDPGTLDAAPALISHADSVEVVGNGTELPVIRVTRTGRTPSSFRPSVLLQATGYLDIENDIDWHESHVLLKAAFPLAATGPFATYEIPYGTIERPTTRNNSWEKAQFEVPGAAVG